MQWLGVFAVTIFWSGIYLLLTKWPIDNSLSISEHVSRNKQTYRFFTRYWIISDILLAIYVLTWLVPEYGYGNEFVITFLVGMGCNLVAAIIPDRKGWQAVVHNVVAYTAALLMAIMTFLIAQHNGIHTFVGIFAYIVLTYMIGSAIAFVTFKRSRNYYLVAQCIYVGGIHSTLILAGLY